MSGEIVPKLSNEKKLLRRSHLLNARNGLENHARRIPPGSLRNKARRAWSEAVLFHASMD